MSSGPVPTPSAPEPFRVLVAGGGPAALEAVLAVRELAGDRVAVTVLTPEAEYVERPLSVGEPFADGPAPRHDLGALVPAMGARLVPDRVAWIDGPARVCHTAGGAALTYDALVLAVGARARPLSPEVTTVDGRNMDGLLRGLVQDVEQGYVRRVAFVVPERAAWPLPMYELALLTAGRAYDACLDVETLLVTPEARPLEAFGDPVADAMEQLLEDGGVEVLGGVRATVPARGTLGLGAGRTLDVDRIVALPVLSGPHVGGVPGGAHGFIPVDPYGRVAGLDAVFAVGDCCDCPIKLGGVGTQQADVAAAVIARAAGAHVEPRPLRADLNATLLTASGAHTLTARAVPGGRGFAAAVADAAPADVAGKLSARLLTPFLAAHAA